MKAGEAKSRSGAARYLEVHRHTVANWLELCEEGGLEGLRKVGEPGPDPGQQSIPSEVMEELKKRLSEPEGFGSYKEVQRWLAEEHGVELPYSTVHRIVRYDLEAKPKAPWCRNSCTSVTQKKRARPSSVQRGPAVPDRGDSRRGRKAGAPVLPG